MGLNNETTLSGLFYINSKKDENCGYLQTVLSWNHFWDNARPSFAPFVHNNKNIFEYLEMFELNDHLSFYCHCKNNNMDLKLWEKKENSLKELMTIPISLNPFYDTFSDPNLANQFYKEKMPVTSFTDWIDVHVGCSVEPALSAKIQVVLAIGTTDQLTAFKNSRNITIPVSITNKVDNATTKKANPIALPGKLSTFIDNLALNLPKRPETDQHSTESSYHLRRTSDLLSVLQKALKTPAPANLSTSSSEVDNFPTVNHRKPIIKSVPVLINIDSARNIVIASNDDKPCTYVSFETMDCDKPEQRLKFATKVAQPSFNPYWNEQFNVVLLNNLEMILKVWRKMSAKQKDQDELIGVTLINLNCLSPATNISGYYDIVDAVGHINGQIKINIVP